MSPVTLLERHGGDLSFPLDVEELARRLGAHVETVEPESLEPECCGRLVRGETTPTRILVASDLSMTPRRFAVAHMLGHLVQGDHAPAERRGHFQWQAATSLESRANTFALDLLIPSLAVRHFVDKRGITRLEKLSDIFGVSQVAMKHQLERLGYLQ